MGKVVGFELNSQEPKKLQNFIQLSLDGKFLSQNRIIGQLQRAVVIERPES